MAKYKVLNEFNLNGIIQKEGDIIDLDFRLANLKSIQGNIEKVPDNTVPKDNSVLGSVVPGVPLTEEQKKKLAEENIAETARAQELAAEQRAKDQAEGRAEPAVKVVADALKDKLVNEEFEQKSGALPEETDPDNLP